VLTVSSNLLYKSQSNDSFIPPRNGYVVPILKETPRHEEKQKYNSLLS